MKRIILALIAVALSIIISFVGFFSVKRTCSKLETKLVEIYETAQSQNAEKALEETEELIKLWDEIHGGLQSFVNHNETDNVEEEIRNLPIVAQQGDMERLAKHIDLAIDELHLIIEHETPFISNIL